MAPLVPSTCANLLQMAVCVPLWVEMTHVKLWPVPNIQELPLLSMQLILGHCVCCMIMFHAFHRLRLGLHSRARSTVQYTMEQYSRHDGTVL